MTGENELTDAEHNFEKLREQRDQMEQRALEAENALAALAGAEPADPDIEVSGDVAELRDQAAALRTQAMRGVLIEAGFDPDTGAAKALSKEMEEGKVELDPGALVSYASKEYGWQPGLTAMETVQAAGSERMTKLSQSTQSEDVHFGDSKAIEQIIEAREDGDWARASAIERRVLARKARKT